MPKSAAAIEPLVKASLECADNYVAAIGSPRSPENSSGWTASAESIQPMAQLSRTSPARYSDAWAPGSSGLGDSPDGTNINAGVGSEHPEALAALVVENAAKLGIAHDGDGDRCVICDELGSVLDGEVKSSHPCDLRFGKGDPRGVDSGRDRAE